MANIYWDVTQSVLIPAISMFLIGWLLGTTNLMKLSYVEALNKYTLYLGIPFAIFTILTAEWFPADQLLFLIPYTLHKIVMILIFFLPLLCFKKYRKELAVMFQLNANYSNNVIYGNALLMALYPLHRMDLLCVLSAIPDVTIVFSTSLFMLETAKAQERAEKDPSRSTSKLSAKDTCKLLPGVLLRVVSNPLIWLTVLGLIFNFCHITKPIWLRNATDFISRSNYATAMINIGVFCAHAPAIKINWSKIFGKCKCLKKKKPEPDSDEHPLLSPAMGQSAINNDSINLTPTKRTCPNFLIVFLFAGIRYALSPAIALLISRWFPISPIHKHAAVLINALPLAVLAFTLSKEFDCYTTEIVLSIILQYFVIILPVFIFWYWLLNKIIPIPG